MIPRDPRTGEFQSTLPRGERPVLIDIIVCRSDFNPRSREGSDYVKIDWSKY